MQDIKLIRESLLITTGYKNPLNSPLWLYNIKSISDEKAEFVFYCFLEELSSIENVTLSIIFKGRKKPQEIILKTFSKDTEIDTAYIVRSIVDVDASKIEKIQCVEIKSSKFSHMTHIYTAGDYKHFEQFRKHGWDYLVDKRNDENTEVERPKKRIWLWILAVVIVLSLTILFLVNVLFANDIYYYKAQQSLQSKDYVQAITSFTELNDFKDSQELLKEAQYGLANQYMETGEYQKAYQLYVELADYMESASNKNKALYLYSVQLMDAGKYEQALDGFSNIKDYEDVNDRVLSIKYLQANQYYEAAKYAEAVNAYRELVNTSISDTNTLFTLKEQAQARKNYYLGLDRILETTSSLPYEDFMTGLKDVYQGLAEFKEDPTVQQAMLSQRYWQIILAGDWKTSNNLFQFNVAVSAEGAFSITHNLEGYDGSLEMKVQDNAIYIKQQGSADFTKWLTIEFKAENVISIFNEKSQTTLEMSK